jgi:hypothetical protein
VRGGRFIHCSETRRTAKVPLVLLILLSGRSYRT